MINIKLMKKIWEEVYDPDLDTTLIIEKYFHPDFEQCINGTIMRRSQYINHVIAQKFNFILERIDYKENLEKKNEKVVGLLTYFKISLHITFLIVVWFLRQF